jgi:WD40 repeat protein
LPLLVEKLDTFAGHRSGIYALVPGAVPEQVFSAGSDGMVIEWNLEKPDLGRLLAQIPASVYALAYDAPRQQLWVGQNFEGLHRLDLVRRTELDSLKMTSAAIFDLLLHEGTAYAALADGTLVVLDVEAFAVRKHVRASEQSARCLALHPAGHELAVGYSDHTIQVFSLPDLRPRAVLRGHTNSVFTVRYAPDGKFLYSGSRDAHLKAWDVSADYARSLDVPAHLFAINHLAFSPDGRWLVSASMDKSIKVWEPGTLKLRKVIDRARHAGHGTSVNKLLWTGYRNQLLSASDDRLISVWALHEGT